MLAPLVLSLYWFFILGALGVFFPFYAAYLADDIGLGGTEIGLVMALIPLVGMAAQPTWGRVADLSGSRTTTLSILSFGAAFGYALLDRADGFASVALGTAALAFFAGAVIPSCVAVSFALLEKRSVHAFGLVRVWGTVGFMVGVIGYPHLARWLAGRPPGADAPLSWMLPLTAAGCFLAGIISFGLPKTGSVSVKGSRGDWRELFRNPRFVRVLVFVFLSYLFLQGPMALFPVYIESIGGNVQTVSNMWLVMLIPEIPLVALSGFFLSHIGARGLIAVGVLSGSVRWLLSATASDLSLVYAAQALHGFTVMGLILGAQLYIDCVVPARLRSTGQAILAMLGVALGSVMSNFFAGVLVDYAGAAAPILIGGLGAGLLALIGPRFVPYVEHREPHPKDAADPQSLPL